MSDTRPPITAGPIERAFKFLKSASVSGSGAREGVGVAEGDDVSCADKVEIAQPENQTAQRNVSRVLIRKLPSRCIAVGQALRLAFLEEAVRSLAPRGIVVRL